MESREMRSFVIVCATALLLPSPFTAGAAGTKPGEGLGYPPVLPGGIETVRGGDASLLVVPDGVALREGVVVAGKSPMVEVSYYPGQDRFDFWSNWGDGLATDGAYYSSIGNHKGLDGRCMVYEWNGRSGKLRMICDVKRLLALPASQYVPGKIHGRIDMGGDGWLYFATARGTTGVTTDAYGYEGDWIIRASGEDEGKAEVVCRGPAGKATIFGTVVDPKRMIFYGGTTCGDNRPDGIGFFAYDLKARRPLHAHVGDGCYKYMMMSRSTGRVYYVGHTSGCLYRYDPETPTKHPVVIAGRPGGDARRGGAFGGDPVQDGVLGLRAATQETEGGFIYTVSGPDEGPLLWRFNTNTEQAEKIGVAAVATQTYVTSIDVDPSGRYLYYTLGAHGGAEKDGAPLVQYDLEARRPKVVAFLRAWTEKHAGFQPRGSFSCAVSPAGDVVYVTWHGTRNLAGNARGLDACALTVVHIPPEERAR